MLIIMPDYIIDGIKGTQTEKNLYFALGGESQAHFKYEVYAKKAGEDGFQEIKKIFNEISENEKAHAEIWFRFLGGKGSTRQNLEASAGGEHYEWSEMYKNFANTARKEGFPAVSDMFDKVASVEMEHDKTYRQYINKIDEGTMFKGSGADTKWICLNCGYIYTGAEPPKICPLCSHSQSYFKEYNQ